VTEQEKEITQPVAVHGSTNDHPVEESTQPVNVTADTPQAQLPEWLLKFAASPEQAADEAQPGDLMDFQAPFFEDLEEEQVFTPPVLPGEYEWKELSDFQEQEPLELEQTVETPEKPLEVEEITEPTESFRQEIRDLLKNGQREQAFALIRENKTDPAMAEAAKKTLRPELTLSPEAGDFWEIYDELNSLSL